MYLERHDTSSGFGLAITGQTLAVAGPVSEFA
jgi:hypothetical protein